MSEQTKTVESPSISDTSKPDASKPDASKPEDSNGNVVNTLNFIIQFIHTLVRFLPLGLYFFVYFSAALFKDLRSAILLIGLILNDLIGYIYKKYNKTRPRQPCAIFVGPGNKEPGFLPNPHTEIMSFIASFFYSDMFYKNKIDIIPFTFITTLLLLTIWSRITIGCKVFKDVVFNIIFGTIRGILFFYFVFPYYHRAEKGQIEKETCELGYDNYRCDEIKEGVVISKNPRLNDRSDYNVDDEEEDDF